MRRRALSGFALTVVAGLALTLMLAATRESRLVYSLGAGAAWPAAVLHRGDTACQAPVAPPAESFDRVVASLGTFRQPGPQVDVEIRAARSKRVLGSGRLPAGYPDIAAAPEHAIAVRIGKLRRPVEICLRNAGNRRVAVYGAPAVAHRTSSATLNGKPLTADLALRLERAEPRALLLRLPSSFEHAARFKAGWVGAWTLWLLAVLVVLAVPALLAKAVADAAMSGTDVNHPPAPRSGSHGGTRREDG